MQFISSSIVLLHALKGFACIIYIRLGDIGIVIIIMTNTTTPPPPSLSLSRYKRHTDKDLIRPLCRVAQETELHFVLCCPVLRTLRAQFIPLKFYKFPSLFRLSPLLASTNENIVRNLSVYLYKAFKLHSISMS